MIKMIYEKHCLNCNTTTYSVFLLQQYRLAEEHMMQTGHIVEVIEHE
jgi:hypothetical protein